MSPTPGRGHLPSHGQVCARVYLREAAANNGQLCPLCMRPLSEHRMQDGPPPRDRDDEDRAFVDTMSAAVAAEVGAAGALATEAALSADPPDFGGGGGGFSGGGADGGW